MLLQAVDRPSWGREATPVRAGSKLLNVTQWMSHFLHLIKSLTKGGGEGLHVCPLHPLSWGSGVTSPFPVEVSPHHGRGGRLSGLVLVEAPLLVLSSARPARCWLCPQPAGQVLSPPYRWGG